MGLEEKPKNIQEWFSKNELALKLLTGMKRKIMEILRKGEKSISEISYELGINKNATRGHLLDLEKIGLVSSKFVKSGIGRPDKVYFLTEQGLQLFDPKYDVFLYSLIEKLDKEHKGILLQILDKIVEELDNEVKKSISPSEQLSKKPEKIEEILNSMGFTAFTEISEDSIQITRSTCPIIKIAKKNPGLICEYFDTNMLRKFTGLDVKLIQTMGKGAQYCLHSFNISNLKKDQ